MYRYKTLYTEFKDGLFYYTKMSYGKINFSGVV